MYILYKIKYYNFNFVNPLLFYLINLKFSFIINSKKSKFIPNVIKSTNEICTKEFSMKKEEILNKLKEIKPLYEKEGLEILGLFGSYAKDTQNEFSDIDIAYRLDYNKFSQKYVDGFSKLAIALFINASKSTLVAWFLFSR